jgi:hypothetical protein
VVKPVTPGKAVDVHPSSQSTTEVDTLQAKLTAIADISAAEFADKHAVKHATLNYDPAQATGLSKIQASRIPLTQAELRVLGTRGFVVSAGRSFPTFTYGYETFYSEHLPLYVSADSVLNAVHRSYDNMLEQIEGGLLVPELGKLLAGMRTSLAAEAAAGSKDADFYLAVGLALLQGTAAPPVVGASTQQIADFVAKATKGEGTAEVTLFGAERDMDFSQFTPRGHYTDTPELERYFRAMMWFGRTEFRLMETKSDGSVVFNRPQFDAMLSIWALMGAENLARHESIDSAIREFVGESDNMIVGDVSKLMSALGVSTLAEAAALPDQRVAQAVIDGGYGTQQIASQLIVRDALTPGPLPLNRSFLLFGQRYAIDSHVFSNVTYDRTTALRMMPNPLDVALAVGKNDNAAALLAPELERYAYAPNLEAVRVLADAHDDVFWNQNIYNVWLSALRALSPANDSSDPGAVGLPLVTGTEAWGKRLLNTQLASWAELRHDTILYVKQSYTSGVACEFPDAYVEPYPEFWKSVGRLAEHGGKVADIAKSAGDAALADLITGYFQNLGVVAGRLGDMADSERTGTPFTAEQLAFINQAVTIENVCGGGMADGWYPQLVYGDSLEYAPTIADVHTQPTDEGGSQVGKILHVGTGSARLMVVTVDTCQGPRAYAGLASSYYEKVTENFDRLTDERWETELGQTPPANVPWVTDFVVGP